MASKLKMKVIDVDSFSDFHEITEKYLGNNFIYRGHSDFDWKLLPKIGRKDFQEKINRRFDEEVMLNSWMRYAAQILIKQPMDIWDSLSLAQHHGLATRLLDWTKNPLIALFFATYDIKSDKDSAVFILDFNDESFNTNKHPSPFKMEFSGIIYPKGLTARVISQRGVFSISHNPTTTLEILLPHFSFVKLRIKSKSKEKIQKTLEQYGINEFFIYQDLDNLSNYLNRFYVSRNTENII